MDYLTQALAVAQLALTLILRVYDDTPVEIRRANIARWDRVITDIEQAATAAQQWLERQQAKPTPAPPHAPGA